MKAGRGKRASGRGARAIAHLKRPVVMAVAGLILVAGAISANALLLQSGRHPAPLFTAKGGPGSLRPQAEPRAVPTPAPDPARFAPPHGAAPEAEVATVQRALARAAYGPIRTDGVFGPQTRDAIARFQADHGLQATGDISDALLLELRAAGALDE